MADPAQAIAVGTAEVPAVRLDFTGVARSIFDEARWSQPERSGRVAVDQRAGRRDLGCRRVRDTVGEDGVGTEALDRVLEVDVPIIDRQGQARDEPRLGDDTNRFFRFFFRCQILVAAETAVILAGGIWRRVLADDEPLCKATEII